MHRIAVIPGDGVGPEVVEIGLRVLSVGAAADPGFAYETVTFPWGSEHHRRTGAMMDADALPQLADFDAVYFGVYTRATIERTARYAFELACTRPSRKLTSVTKSNASLHASVLWDEVVSGLAAEFNDVEFEERACARSLHA